MTKDPLILWYASYFCLDPKLHFHFPLAGPRWTQYLEASSSPYSRSISKLQHVYISHT